MFEQEKQEEEKIIKGHINQARYHWCYWKLQIHWEILEWGFPINFNAEKIHFYVNPEVFLKEDL